MTVSKGVAMLVRTVVMPWIDKAIGRPGTVSFEEWVTACDTLVAALDEPSEMPEPEAE